jgi:thiosulfate dehydrogenase [quinone] large subunit
LSSGREGLAEIERRLGGWEPGRGEGARGGGRPRPPRSLPPGLALLPLRLFLGVTFVYAGIQKLSDPGFLHPGAPTYIGTQLHQFAHGTPGGFILRAFAFPAPGLAGVVVAVVEIAVGLLILAGFLTRPAAFVGMCLNLLLFLTNSWNTYPYFLGSDIVFVFAWLPLVLAGANGQPSLDRYLAGSLARRRARSPASARRPLGARQAADPADLTRRGLIARGLGATALLTGLIAGLAALSKGGYRGAPQAKTLGSGGAPASAGHGSKHSARSGTGKAGTAKTGSSSPPAGARALGPASRLPPGQAAYYRDPANGSPDILVRDGQGGLAAHSAICTHAGCTVQYSGGQLVCPCHGSIFNAATGAVLQGPAVAPLPARRVIERGGELYALPS